MLGSESHGWVVGVADTKVSMLTENDQTLCLLSNGLCHETSVIVKTVDVSFVSSVEKDWASLWIPVGSIN